MLTDLSGFWRGFRPSAVQVAAWGHVCAVRSCHGALDVVNVLKKKREDKIKYTHTIYIFQQ